jgi:hypothetical protein
MAMKSKMAELARENEKLANDSRTLQDLGFVGIVEPRPSCLKGHEMRPAIGNPYERGHVRCDHC